MHSYFDLKIDLSSILYRSPRCQILHQGLGGGLWGAKPGFFPDLVESTHQRWCFESSMMSSSILNEYKDPERKNFKSIPFSLIEENTCFQLAT